LAVTGDVPPAREYQPCSWLGVVEHRLSRSGRVAVDPARAAFWFTSFSST
jgi:hypothetical protein